MKNKKVIISDTYDLWYITSLDDQKLLLVYMCVYLNALAIYVLLKMCV